MGSHQRVQSISDVTGDVVVFPFVQYQSSCCVQTTWMHSRSKHWHLLDYVIVRRSDCRNVHLTRAMSGAECWTDHRLVRSSIQFNIRPPVRKRQPKKRLDVIACDDPLKVDLLRE